MMTYEAQFNSPSRALWPIGRCWSLFPKALSQTPVFTLRDHGYGASVSRGVPVNIPTVKPVPNYTAWWQRHVSCVWTTCLVTTVPWRTTALHHQNGQRVAESRSTSCKHAIVTSLLKKTRLDSSDMNNFRLVSNLSFILKSCESGCH